MGTTEKTFWRGVNTAGGDYYEVPDVSREMCFVPPAPDTSITLAEWQALNVIPLASDIEQVLLVLAGAFKMRDTASDMQVRIRSWIPNLTYPIWVIQQSARQIMTESKFFPSSFHELNEYCLKHHKIWKQLGDFLAKPKQQVAFNKPQPVENKDKLWSQMTPVERCEIYQKLINSPIMGCSGGRAKEFLDEFAKIDNPTEDMILTATKCRKFLALVGEKASDHSQNTMQHAQ